MNLTSMEWVRGALYNAQESGLDLSDVIEMARHAETRRRISTEP